MCANTKTYLEKLLINGVGNQYETTYAAILNYATTNSNLIENIDMSDTELQRLLDTGRVYKSDVKIDDAIVARNLFFVHRNIVEMAVHSESIIDIEKIKCLHAILLTGHSKFLLHQDEIGTWKKHDNVIGATTTALVDEVESKMACLISTWNAKPTHSLEDIAQFHIDFERIHPFVDGNGRIGRALMLGQIIEANLPIGIIEYENREEYYKCFVPGNEHHLVNLLHKEQKAFEATYVLDCM